jgi:glucose-6-phosphate isomerase
LRVSGSAPSILWQKIFVQGIISNVNWYNQRGLELGKRLDDAILPELRVPDDISSHDSSTDGPSNRIKRRQKGSGSAGG